MLRNYSLDRRVSVLIFSIFSSLTWCNQSEVCAAGTSDRTLCLSTLHFGGPSTAAWPGHWCPLCARGSCGGARQGLSWISQPAKIQFPNNDHREKSLSGANFFFFFSEEQVCRSVLSAANRPLNSVLQPQPLPTWTKRPGGTWTKEKEAIWPVRVRAQSLQRLNAPADQKHKMKFLKKQCY